VSRMEVKKRKIINHAGNLSLTLNELKLLGFEKKSKGEVFVASDGKVIQISKSLYDVFRPIGIKDETWKKILSEIIKRSKNEDDILNFINEIFEFYLKEKKWKIEI